MRINLPLPTIILILYIVYVIFSMIMKKIRFNAENLEEVKKIISEDPFNIYFYTKNKKTANIF